MAGESLAGRRSSAITRLSSCAVDGSAAGGLAVWPAGFGFVRLHLGLLAVPAVRLRVPASSLPLRARRDTGLDDLRSAFRATIALRRVDMAVRRCRAYRTGAFARAHEAHECPAQLPRMKTRREPRRRLLHDAQSRCAATAGSSVAATASFAALFGRAVPEDLLRYAPDDLAALAARAWCSCASASRARRKSASSLRRLIGVGDASSRSRCIEIVNDDMPFLVDLGAGRAHRARARCSARRASGLRRRARQRGKLTSFASRPAADGAARKLHPHPSRAHRGRGAPRRHRRRRSSTCSADVRLRVQDWRPMLDARRRGRSPSSRPIRRRCRSTRSPRRSSSWTGCVANNFTFLGVRDYALRRTDALRARFRQTGSASCARPTCGCSARGNELLEFTPEIMAFLQGAEAADHHQGQCALARAPARLSRLYRRQALRRRRATSSANSASSACSPRPPIRARRAAFRICGARSPRSTQRAGFDPDEPFRQGAGQRAGALSARRAVPDRRGHALPASRSRSCSSTSGRACACWRGATASTASSRCSSSCRASATTATCARGSATIWPGASSAASRRSIRSSRKGRWCACISSSAATAARRRIRSRATLGARGRDDRAHLDRRARARRSRWCIEPDKAHALFERYRDAFSDGYREAYSPADRGRRHPVIESAVGGAPARRRFLSPARRATQRASA